MQNTKPAALTILLFMTVSAHAVYAQSFVGKKYFTKDTVYINPDQVGYERTDKSAIYTFDGTNVNIEDLTYIEENDTRYRVTGVDREGTLQYYKRILNGSRIDIYSKNVRSTEIYPIKNYVDKDKIFMEIDGGRMGRISFRNLQPFAANNSHVENELKRANKLRLLNGFFAVSAATSFLLLASGNFGIESIGQANLLIPIALLVPIGISGKSMKKRYYNTIDYINVEP